MRKLAALVALSLIFSFTCGYLLIVVQQSLKQTTRPELISAELHRFIKEAAKPEAVLILGKYEDDLLNPELALPQTAYYERLDLLALEQFQKSCLPVKRKWPKALSKAVEFYDGLCRKKEFPPGFFARKPLMLPSGESFSAVAMKMGAQSEEAASFLHLTERSTVPLSDFQWRNWSQIYRKNRVVQTLNYVLIRTNYLEDDMTYSVYPMAAWKSFWNGTGFKPTALIPDSRRDCFSSVEGVCWSVNYLKAVRYQRGTQILGLCLLLVTTLVLFVLLLLEVIQKRRDSEKIKFSLDMLTHELRTPLTQLNFNIEKMRDQFDVLPDAAQLGLLDMMNQVQKLNLLARNSTHYLSGSKESYFKIQPTEVTDFKIFVEHILDLYLNEISVVWNGEKAHFKIDLFWFGVCLKNLVENALKHGQKPIVVGITSNVDEISIEVQDAGEFKKKSRADDESDQNLGLGLGLVRKILKQMNGELEMKSNPTRAIMRVKKYEE